MAWYDNLSPLDQTLARANPAGLAVIHTQPFSPESGQRWKLFPYMRLITERITPLLLNGGRGMLFMPVRHGKSMFSSIYTPAWFLMTHVTKNVILTSYSADLSAGFSSRARTVVEDMGHLFGVRVNPKQNKRDHWQIQYLDPQNAWRNGGEVYATGVDGSLPGRGGHLIVMDDVVRGHKDTTPAMMEKAYKWYRAVLETRQEPGCAMLLVMTRWAMADLAGRLLEDEPEEWDILTLPALAKDDDPLGRKPGEALCPQRYDEAWLEKKRDSSDEGGLIFSALYQQEPMPEDGAIFKGSQMIRWEGLDDLILFQNRSTPRKALLLWFATIDPALKDKHLNDPTGFLVWALTITGELMLMEDHTKRMSGSTDLIPLMREVLAEHPSIHFYVEDAAHGTEIIRACEREHLPMMHLKADRDKVTRAIGAQPAFSAGKVFLPARGADAVVRELLEFPGGRHDDRVDCVAYAVQVWRDRVKRINGPRPMGDRRNGYVPAETHNIHPADRPDPVAAGRDRRGKWTP